jgi:hypothetical protein
MDRTNGEAGKGMRNTLVGGGEKTSPVPPGKGKIREPDQMPKGIGGSTVKTAPGDIFTVPGRFGIDITVIIPAKKLELFFLRYPFKELQQINTYPRSAPGGGKGVYTDFHAISIPFFCSTYYVIVHYYPKMPESYI